MFESYELYNAGVWKRSNIRIIRDKKKYHPEWVEWVEHNPSQSTPEEDEWLTCCDEEDNKKYPNW